MEAEVRYNVLNFLWQGQGRGTGGSVGHENGRHIYARRAARQVTYVVSLPEGFFRRPKAKLFRGTYVKGCQSGGLYVTSNVLLPSTRT